MSNILKINLPATSANLGPGFDAAAVALDFSLELSARVAHEFSIQASGRNADECALLQDNLILTVYSELLQHEGRAVKPLAIEMRNGIPLGMGCGSSAAGRLAAIALANHFGELGWTSERILEAACRLEGHPDNVAACWLGGFVVAAMERESVRWARVAPPSNWSALLVMPDEQLATTKARAVLPASYTRADAVTNIQSAALLSLAFAQGRGELLTRAMQDRIHQPYRAEICSLLPALLPLAGKSGVLGVALSGAGPSVLVIVEKTRAAMARESVEAAVSGKSVEIVVTDFSASGATVAVGSQESAATFSTLNASKE